MSVLKFILYSVCFICVVWIGLLFGAPIILKSMISSFSNGQITASGVTVTPNLDIKIRQLDYNIKSADEDINYEGLSRSVNLLWSIFGGKPLLEVQFGPTFIKDLISIDQAKISSLSFSEISFENLFLNAEMDSISMGSDTTIEGLNLQGIYHLERGVFSEITVTSNSVSTNIVGQWSFAQVFAKTSEVDLTKPLEQQFIAVDFFVAEALGNQAQTNLTGLNGVLKFEEDEFTFRLDAGDFDNYGVPGLLGKIRAEGVVSQKNLLKQARVELLSLSTEDSVLGQSSISIDILNSGGGTYKIHLSGELGAFGVTFSENYFGEFPDSKFGIEVGLDSTNAQINVTAQLDLENLSVNEIFADGNLSLTLDQDKTLFTCFTLNCRILALASDYEVALGGERISGKLNCGQEPCNLRSISHTVKTSDTGVIFSKINESKIINPLHAFYLYTLISGGKKLGNGHQITIN